MSAVVDVVADRPHPAAFPDRILDALRAVVPAPCRVLDPLAGVGRLGRLAPWGWAVTAVEIEPEWAAQCEGAGCVRTIVGDARGLPADIGVFDAVVTSPAYANRLADGYAPSDAGRPDGRMSHRTRRSYRLSLGRPLDPANGAGMRWGPKYRSLHAAVVVECVRVLRPGGLFVVDVKDHVRDGMLQRTPDWWEAVLAWAGLAVERRIAVPTAGDQNSARHRARGRATVDAEEIIVARLPGNPSDG